MTFNKKNILGFKENLRLFFVNKIEFLRKNDSDDVNALKIKRQAEKRRRVELRKAKLDDLKATIVDWFLMSNVDCFPKIIQTKNLVGKIFWCILLVVFSCATIWLLTACILAYFEYEVVSKI